MTKSINKGLLYRRVVVKFGTSLLTGGSDHLDQEVMNDLVDQVAALHGQGSDVIIVSSGAIASGRYKLGLTKRRKDIPFKQVLASVGQGRLMNAYEELFSRHNITVAQALLTKTDLSDRSGYLNARNTLLALMDYRVISIVNENDVVAIDEIQGARFGDNDNLSAMVANLVDADLLLLLTDIGGLYNTDPHRDPSARLIPIVPKITPDIRRLVAGTSGGLGTGGMITKVEAARLATASGVHVFIANGREVNVITRLASGENTGTHFLPAPVRLDSRKRWMLSGLCTRGKLIIDAGAAMAILRNKRSLLATGIKGAEGAFERGDIVAVHTSDGLHIGYGIANYGSRDIDVIKGAQSGKISSLLGFDYGPEVVHRNNLTLLEREDSSEHRQTLQLRR